MGSYTANFDATGATIEREGTTARYHLDAPTATNAADFVRAHRKVVIAMTHDTPEDLEAFRVERQTDDARQGDTAAEEEE